MCVPMLLRLLVLGSIFTMTALLLISMQTLPRADFPSTSFRLVQNLYIRHHPLPAATVVENDDYCDTAEGVDEPLTSACAGRARSRFFCSRGSRLIPSSRVGDGTS